MKIPTNSHLVECIRNYDWKAVEFACINHVHLFKGHEEGSFPLHEICSIGSAPSNLVEKIFRLYPEAAILQNNSGDTPLHLKCKISQKSLDIVNLLVNHWPETLLLKNGIGHTPLAEACISAAWFPVIEKLVASEPYALSIRDNQGNSPIDLLWSSFSKNIPGVLSLKSYLRGNAPMSGILARFWEKVCFCFIESFKLHQNDSEKIFWEERDSGHELCHSIISENLRQCPEKLLQLALFSNPSLAHQTDINGNTPLHLAVKGKDKGAILLLLEKCVESAFHRNNHGKLPIHLLINNGKKWHHDVVEAFIKYSPDCIASEDCSNNLYPFMIAAASYDAATSYQLLLIKPEILMYQYDT
jgi:ankyrin repeat protein